MGNVSTVTLVGKAAADNRLPISTFGFFMDNLATVAQRSVRMAFQRRSTSSGPKPAWLQRVSDIRYIGYELTDEGMDLLLDAPTLGESMAEIYREMDFQSRHPDLNDTALDLVWDVVSAIQSNYRDSMMLDESLLRSVGHFSRSLNGYISEVRINSRRQASAPATLDINVAEVAGSMVKEFQSRRQVRIVGELDMVSISNSTFALKLADGTDLRGILVAGDIHGTARMLSTEVLVRGYLYYRLSGRPLRIDADSIETAINESSTWTHLPEPPTRRNRLPLVQRDSLRVEQTPWTGLGAIVGKWPGNETDDEVSEALEIIS